MIIPVNLSVRNGQSIHVCVRVLVCTEDFKVDISCLEVIMVVISLCALNCRTCPYKGLCVKPDI